MKEVLAQIHNIATSLENKKAFKQANKLNNLFIKIAEEVQAAKKKKKTKKNVPTNPELWAQCKAWAKRTFDVYPSAYANGAAAKRYKAKGGDWKTASNDSSFVKLAKKTPEQLLAEIYQTAEKINKLDDSKGNDKLEALIEEMMGHNKDLPTMELNPVNHEDMSIEAESNLEDAINNFDSNLYKVDPHGDWKGSEWMKIDEYIEMLIDKYGENIMSAPAAIDANHIAFDSPEGFQVINMVHKSNWNHGN
jgi:hypothetical protein